MVKKILIISSDITGHGHKSITEALCEKGRAHDDVEIHVVDGFSLGGKVLLGIGKSYGPITRHTEGLWKYIWNLSAMNPEIIDHFFESLIRDNFMALLNKVKPDIILSVHPNFNGCILNILDKERIKLPFMTLIADLVNIYPLWADNRADYIICPTFEARDQCIELGIHVEKLKVLGFPVRSRFFRGRYQQISGIKQGMPISCLIMGGGEGSGNMQTIAEDLLRDFDCTVRIAAGRNEKLKSKLEKSLKGRYGSRAEIYGFTNQIHDLMMASDFIITRGSPNVMFEAIAINTPLIITGSLPGQEEGNPAFAEQHSLAVLCSNPANIKNTINELFDHDGKLIKQMVQTQRNFMKRNAAEDILQFILEAEEPYPEAKLKLS